MSDSVPQVHLVRHGATEWSVAGKHTGRTDIPLSASGRAQAEALRTRLHALKVENVFSSPLVRARETAALAGFASEAETDADLLEWDYGTFEGRRTSEIRAEQPGWDLFEQGCPGGEGVDAVAARADRFIARIRKLDGNVLLFAHRDILRVIAARWVSWPGVEARRLYLEPASLSILGYDHGSLDEPILRVLNDYDHARSPP
jgi:broad specificity phosphatase PhoE